MGRNRSSRLDWSCNTTWATSRQRSIDGSWPKCGVCRMCWRDYLYGIRTSRLWEEHCAQTNTILRKRFGDQCNCEHLHCHLLCGCHTYNTSSMVKTENCMPTRSNSVNETREVIPFGYFVGIDSSLWFNYIDGVFLFLTQWSLSWDANGLTSYLPHALIRKGIWDNNIFW